jgi:hypothetical protein
VPLTPEQEAAAAEDPDLAPLPGPGVPEFPSVADAAAETTDTVVDTAADTAAQASVSPPALPLP